MSRRPPSDELQEIAFSVADAFSTSVGHAMWSV